jgi:hypothetical protein
MWAISNLGQAGKNFVGQKQIATVESKWIENAAWQVGGIVSG